MCKFCDTDFFGTDGRGGGRFETPLALAAAARALWPESAGKYAHAFLVCTGGEPLLQLDEPLVLAFRAAGFEVAVETNGTKLPPRGLSWVCVSPKAGTELLVKSGDELKSCLSATWRGAGALCQDSVLHRSPPLQPMDAAEREKNTELCLQYCRNIHGGG